MSTRTRTEVVHFASLSLMDFIAADSSSHQKIYGIWQQLIIYLSIERSIFARLILYSLALYNWYVLHPPTHKREITAKATNFKRDHETKGLSGCNQAKIWTSRWKMQWLITLWLGGACHLYRWKCINCLLFLMEFVFARGFFAEMWLEFLWNGS